MPLKSPHIVSYDDLIAATSNRLEWMEKNYPGKVLSKEINEWTATHNIEVYKRLVKLLKKFKKEPQLDLFQAFEKLK